MPLKIRQTVIDVTAEPVELVDDNNVEPMRPGVGLHALPFGAIGLPARKPSVDVAAGDLPATRRGEGLTGRHLGFEAMAGLGLLVSANARVDRASNHGRLMVTRMPRRRAMRAITTARGEGVLFMGVL